MGVRWQESIENIESESTEPQIYSTDNGQVCIPSDAAVHVVDSEAGLTRTFDLDGDPRRPIAIDDGRLYVKERGDDHYTDVPDPVTAYDHQTGIEQWCTESDLGGAGVVRTAGVVCAVNRDGPLAIDASSGEVLWKFLPDSEATMGIVPNDTVSHSPVAGIDSTFFVSMQGPQDQPSENEIWAVDARSGDPRWKTTLSDWIPGSIVATSDAIFALLIEDDDHDDISRDGAVVALDRETGQRRFLTEIGLFETRFQPISVSEQTGNLRIEARSWTYCVDTDTGEVAWRDEVPTPSVQIGNRLYASGPSIQVYDVETGNHYRSEAIDQPFYEAPELLTYTAGTLFVGRTSISSIDLAAIELEDVPDEPEHSPESEPTSVDAVRRDGTRCPDCDTDLSGDEAFCPNCGHDLSEPTGCPSCGTELDGDESFCPSCGQNLE